MAKAVPDAVLDLALNDIKTSTTQYICSGEPANFAGIAAVTLASTSMAGGDYTGPAAGSTPTSGKGRKLTMAAKSILGAGVTTSGTATHVALATASVLKYVTTCTSQALTAGNPVNIPAWNIEIAGAT